MFKIHFLKEFKFWLKQWVTYIYLFVFTAMVFLIFAGSLGFFDPVNEREGLQQWLNSPSSINNYVLYLHKFSLILIPAIIAASLHKDYKSRFHSLFYSYPIQKQTYLFGRFAASFSIVTFISLALVLSFMIAEHLPGLDHQLMGPFKLSAYINVGLFYILPNLLCFGLMSYSLIALTRNIYAGYVVLIIPFLIQYLAENAFSQSAFLLCLFDPFAQNVAAYYQKDWDLNALNQNAMPLDFYLVFNRIFWLGIAGTLYYYAQNRFEFVEEIAGFKINLKGIEKEINLEKLSHEKLGRIKLNFSFLQKLRTIWFISVKHFRVIVKNPFLWVIIFLGILSVVFIVVRVTQKEEFTLVPSTQFLIGFPTVFYNIILLLATILFSGLIINRDENSRMDALIHASAQPAYVFVFGKFLSIVKMQLLMLGILLLSFIILQTTNGFYEHQINLVLFELFIKSYLPILSWTFLAFFIHSFFRNIYFSLFALLLLWMGVQGMNTVGIESYLLKFNELPKPGFSDISGYDYNLKAYFIIGIYHLLIAFLFFYVSILIWKSDLISGWKAQWQSIYRNLNVQNYIIILTLVASIFFIAQFIYQAESERKAQLSIGSNENFKVFEKHFEVYRDLPFPKIISLKANVDIYPEREFFEAKGEYILKNKGEEPLQRFLIKTGFDEISTFEFNREFKILETDSIFKVYLIELANDLDTQESMKLTFSMKSQTNELLIRNSNVLNNGTFLQQDIFPRFGYQFDEEAPDPEDDGVENYNYQSIDADKIVLDLTVSTSVDQYAITAGNLHSYEQKSGRNIFHYTCPEPVKFSFGISSGRYVKEQIAIKGKIVELFLYHHNAQNSVLEGLENALELNEKNFSNYTFDTIRVIEFPITEGTYSTAYANNLMLSELRLLSSKTDESSVDISYYVSAHEFTHHWWGNQLIPARARGATMLSESITEYLMLRILEKYQGVSVKDQFYELQKKRYQNGKKSINYEEPPLVRVQAEEQFISYGKGAVAFYDLSEIIGEDKFYDILSEFMSKYKNVPPYPTSLDFVSFLKERTDESMHKLIDNY